MSSAARNPLSPFDSTKQDPQPAALDMTSNDVRFLASLSCVHLRFKYSAFNA
jgi:hypothetical protein